MKFFNKFKFSLPPLPTPPPVHAPDRSTQLQLALVILIAVVAHFSIASTSIGVFALIIWALKTGLVFRRLPNPPQFVVMLLTIVSLLMILWSYGGWNGQKAGMSFLVLLVSLKFLESSKLRDYYIVCLILFFLSSSSFLFNSSLLSIFLVIAYVLMVTTLLLKISDPTSSKLPVTIRVAGSIMLKALPLAIILFFFFPRIQGNFGFIPSQDEIGSDNELSNSLVAGDFATGAFNNSPAFRVEFEGEIPSNNRLYWRAKVMIDEQNFQWALRIPTPAQIRKAQRRKRSSRSDQETVSYEIVHENSNDSFAPFLDYVVNQSLGAQLDDHAVYLPRKTEGIFTYRGKSTPGPNLTMDTAPDFGPLLDTRSKPETRTLALLSQWRRTSNNERELVAAVLRYFTDNEFNYSLTPPGLGNSPVDEFLFDSKTGYCEHYASTFTIIMRWLGIPARVVVGYQGGLRNQVGNYLEVRYSDAHAWSEVWIDGQWRRIDPTAAISPERIEYGMDPWMNVWLDSSFGDNATGRALANYLNPTGFNKLYRQLRDGWDNVGYRWNKWVVNYNFESQRNLLERIGLKHRDSLYTLIGLVFAGTMMLMLFYFWQLIPKPVKIGEAQQTYLKFVTRFKRQKLTKGLSETPSEFAQKVKALFPEQAQEIQNITLSYLQIRYGLGNTESTGSNRPQKALESFKQQVKRFKLKPRDVD